ncbi:hypothetical protein Tco_0425732 [Tanacetum coccineum]
MMVSSVSFFQNLSFKNISWMEIRWCYGDGEDGGGGSGVVEVARGASGVVDRQNPLVKSLSLEHPCLTHTTILSAFALMLTALLLCSLLGTSRRSPKPVLLSLKHAQLPVLGSTRMYRDLSLPTSGPK